MSKDIEQELDAILTPHKARVSAARDEAAGRSAAAAEFVEAAAVCLGSVVVPTLEAMARALNERGIAARLRSDAGGARIDIPVSRHVRLGHGLGGYPYFRARPETQLRRICFEQNSAGGRGASAVGDYAVAEVTGDLVKEKVLALLRQIFGAG